MSNNIKKILVVVLIALFALNFFVIGNEAIFSKSGSKTAQQSAENAGGVQIGSGYFELEDFNKQKFTSENLKGKIIDVVEPGYKLGDKVVRFAKVVTGA